MFRELPRRSASSSLRRVLATLTRPTCSTRSVVEAARGSGEVGANETRSGVRGRGASPHVEPDINRTLCAASAFRWRLPFRLRPWSGMMWTAPHRQPKISGKNWWFFRQSSAGQVHSCQPTTRTVCELERMVTGNGSEPTVIDLFCGAGGLSAGLEAAGWQTVAAVDLDKDCVKTLTATKARRIGGPTGRAYLAGARLICDDISRLTRHDLRPDGVGPKWRPDLLAGGPPCQPFSSAGRMRGLDDPRGQLFIEFVRLAEELKPRFILFENVAGLVTARGYDGTPGGVLELVQESFERIGYACRFALLNSADFGAAQRRVRLFMIASSGEALPQFPAQTHSREPVDGLFGRTKAWVTLGGFLAALPEPDPDEIVRPSEQRSSQMATLLPGTGLKASGIVEANRPGGHWGYRQDCFLADPALPARTIRAASTPDFVRLPDGSLRRLTWRECAALQGFPAEWEFVGTIASKFRQIGNAVQGNVASALGKTLAEAAAARVRARPSSADWPASFHRRVRYTAMEEVVNGGHRAAAKQARSLSEAT